MEAVDLTMEAVDLVGMELVVLMEGRILKSDVVIVAAAPSIFLMTVPSLLAPSLQIAVLRPIVAEMVEMRLAVEIVVT